MPELKNIKVQPFLEPGSPPIAGMNIAIIFASEEEMQRLLNLISGPGAVLTITGEESLASESFTAEPHIEDLLVYNTCVSRGQVPS